MINLNTNLSALNVQRSLLNSTELLNNAIERLTTGFKVNRAADNAANFNIIQQMNSQISSLDVAEDNVAMGIDMVSTANDIAEMINDRLTRLRNLAAQAQNETYGKDSLDAINTECNALVDEIERLYEEAEYNGIKLYGFEVEEEPVQAVMTYSARMLTAATVEVTADTGTTLKELGIENSSFTVLNKSGEEIISYDTEINDTLGDVFNVLSGYGIVSTITDGVISMISDNGNHVSGDLIERLGISINSDITIDSSQQNSMQEVSYTLTLTATESTTLAELGALTSGKSTITINDKYGDKVANVTLQSTMTLENMFAQLANYDIQGSITNGVISLESSSGNYVVENSTMSALGITNEIGTSYVTGGISQTSTTPVTYTSITTEGGYTYTTTIEQTNTIWTTTTSSSTQTNTVWVTTTTSMTQTQTIEETTTVPVEQITTIWTTTTSSMTQTETIWTTTTTSTTQTNTIWTTTTLSTTQTNTIWTTTTTPTTQTETIWQEVTGGQDVVTTIWTTTTSSTTQTETIWTTTTSSTTQTETIWTTTTSSTTQTETIWTTTTSSTTQTETIWTTTTSSTTQTETIWTTTTSSTTQTETIWTTTTSSTTQTEIIINTPVTSGIAMTSSASLTYTINGAVTEDTLLSDFLDLSDTSFSYHDASTGEIWDADLSDVVYQGYASSISSMTLGQLFEELSTQGYQATVSSTGIITIISDDSARYLTGSIFSQMGITANIDEGGIQTKGYYLTSTIAATHALSEGQGSADYTTVASQWTYLNHLTQYGCYDFQADDTISIYIDGTTYEATMEEFMYEYYGDSTPYGDFTLSDFIYALESYFDNNGFSVSHDFDEETGEVVFKYDGSEYIEVVLDGTTFLDGSFYNGTAKSTATERNMVYLSDDSLVYDLDWDDYGWSYDGDYSSNLYYELYLTKYDESNNWQYATVSIDVTSTTVGELNEMLAEYDISITTNGANKAIIKQDGIWVLDGNSMFTNLLYINPGPDFYTTISVSPTATMSSSAPTTVNVEKTASLNSTLAQFGYISEGNANGEGLVSDINYDVLTITDKTNSANQVNIEYNSDTTLQELANSLSAYNISLTISNGKVTLTPSGNYYISDMGSVGDNLKLAQSAYTVTTTTTTRTVAADETIYSTLVTYNTSAVNMTSTSAITYQVETVVGLNTKLKDFLNLSDTAIYDNNVDGTKCRYTLDEMVMNGNVASLDEATVADLFDFLSSMNYQATINTNGIISITAEDSAFYLSGSIFEQLGITSNIIPAGTYLTQETICSDNTVYVVKTYGNGQTMAAEGTTSLEDIGFDDLQASYKPFSYDKIINMEIYWNRSYYSVFNGMTMSDFMREYATSYKSSYSDYTLSDFMYAIKEAVNSSGSPLEVESCYLGSDGKMHFNTNSTESYYGFSVCMGDGWDDGYVAMYDSYSLGYKEESDGTYTFSSAQFIQYYEDIGTSTEIIDIVGEDNWYTDEQEIYFAKYDADSDEVVYATVTFSTTATVGTIESLFAEYDMDLCLASTGSSNVVKLEQNGEWVYDGCNGVLEEAFEWWSWSSYDYVVSDACATMSTSKLLAYTKTQSITASDTMSDFGFIPAANVDEESGKFYDEIIINDSTNSTSGFALKYYSDTTFAELASALTDYGINLSINNGKVNITSSGNYYIQDLGSLADAVNMSSSQGYTVTSSNTTTAISTTQTNTIWATTTSSATQTNTIWTTTTSSATQTNTIWTTTTSSATQTNTIWTTTTSSATQTNTIWTTTTSSATQTNTIWTTTTSSATQTNTIWTTTTSSATQTQFIEETTTIPVEQQTTIWTTTTSSTTQTETIWTTTTSSTTQTETIWTTTTSSATQTNTVWTTTTSSATQTTTIQQTVTGGEEVVSTIWTTTTSSTTQTETIWTTTTSSATQTTAIETTHTVDATSTTVLKTMTGTTTLDELGVNSETYITIMNGNTQTVVTVASSDTINQLKSKLASEALSVSFSKGKLTIAPNDDSIYILGASDSLEQALNLNKVYYTVQDGIEMKESRQLEYQSVYVMNEASLLSEYGVTDGNIYVIKDGNVYETIYISSSESVEATLNNIENYGFITSLKNGVVSIKANGNIFLSETDSAVALMSLTSDSSNILTVFNLGNVQQTETVIYSNTESYTLLPQAVPFEPYYQSSGSVNIQAGITSDSANRIEISMGFVLDELDALRKIGKNTITQRNYLELLDNMISIVNLKQVEYGAALNRLESAFEEITIRYDNLVSSRSTLRDADIAEETSKYIQQQILQQAAATLLSVANQTPQLALQLL